MPLNCLGWLLCFSVVLIYKSFFYYVSSCHLPVWVIYYIKSYLLYKSIDICLLCKSVDVSYLSELYNMNVK